MGIGDFYYILVLVYANTHRLSKSPNFFFCFLKSEIYIPLNIDFFLFALKVIHYLWKVNLNFSKVNQNNLIHPNFSVILPKFVGKFHFEEENKKFKLNKNAS